jgi:hypothetical protein
MTTREVMKIAEERGFKVVLAPDGHPVLQGDRANVTDKLMAVLKIHREAIILILTEEMRKRPGDARED